MSLWGSVLFAIRWLICVPRRLYCSPVGQTGVSTRLVGTFLLLGLLAGCSARTADEHLQSARDYLNAGNDDAAIIELKNALKLEPEHVVARGELADLLFASGDYRAAAADYHRALAAPDASSDQPAGRFQELQRHLWLAQIRVQEAAEVLSDLTAKARITETAGLPAKERALLGLARLALDDAELAASEFSKALAIDEREPLAHYGLARLQWLARDVTSATQSFAAATKSYQRDPEVLLTKAEFELEQRDFSAARDTYTLAKALPGNDVAAALGLVRIQIFEREYDAAEAALQDVLQTAPGYLPALYLAALVRYEQGDLNAAQLQLREVLGGQSGYAPALYLMGAVQFQQKQFLQAESNLATYLRSHPENPSARKLLGAVRMQTGNYEGVVAALGAVAAHTEDAQTLAMLGTAYARLNRLNEASELLDRAVALAPDVGELRNQLAVTLLAAGESEQAIGQLRSAIKLDDELQLSDYLLVLAQLREGNVEQALAAANALRARAPEDPMGENLLGAVRFAQGDSAQARAAFEAALQINPEFQPAALNLVRLELAEGNTEQAKAGLERLLEDDPDNERALLQLAELELEPMRRSGALRASTKSERARLDLARVQTRLARAARAHPASLSPRLALARFALLTADPEAALLQSEKALEIAPANPDALTVRVEALLLAKDRAATLEPLKALERVLRESPADPNRMLVLGRLYERSGQQSRARSIYQALLDSDAPGIQRTTTLALTRFDLAEGNTSRARRRIDELGAFVSASDPDYQLLRSDVLRAEGQWRAAEEGYAALAVEGNRDAMFRLVALYTQRQQPGQAAEVLRAWQQQHPDDLGAEVALATSSLSAGDYPDAQARFEEVLVRAPDNVVVLNNLAWLYQRTGDPRAREVAQRAWSLAPNSADVGDTYGWILVTSGQVERGRNVLLKAHGLAPRNPSIAFHTASALAETGRREQALATLQAIGEQRLAQSPDADAALALLRKLVSIDEIEGEAKQEDKLIERQLVNEQ